MTMHTNAGSCMGIEDTLLGMSARSAAEEDIAPGDLACMTMRWLAAAEGL
jgi:hypothetical protein